MMLLKIAVKVKEITTSAALMAIKVKRKIAN
jgi:hypothetical protein